MLLNEYPELIAQTESEILQIDQRIRSVQNSLSTHGVSADREVAFDDTLKNDTQRKVRRADLLRCNAEYQQILICSQELCDRRERLQIELSLLQNQFTVQKLAARQAVAFQERRLIEAA